MIPEQQLTRMLNVRHPILLAAMDIISDARLTLAVSDAGGFGILGGGYGNAEWLTRELAILNEARKGRDVSFGIGFITWSLAQQPHLLDQALDSKPNAIWLSFGDPAPFVKKIKAAGALTICQVQTLAMAKDAVAKGADVVVAQGGEAGGHGISSGGISLVPAIVDAVDGKAPVVMAGGIADGRGLAAARMLGAQGIVLGTRFYTSQESIANPAAKARIVEASVDDTVRGIIFDISRDHLWPAPYTGRVLANEHSRKWEGRELELMRNLHDEGPKYMAARSRGDFSIAAVIAGESVGVIDDIPTVQEIVDRIMKEANALMSSNFMPGDDDVVFRKVSAAANNQT